MKAKITVTLEDGSGCTFTANDIRLASQQTNINIVAFGVSELKTIQPEPEKEDPK